VGCSQEVASSLRAGITNGDGAVGEAAPAGAGGPGHVAALHVECGDANEGRGVDQHTYTEFSARKVQQEETTGQARRTGIIIQAAPIRIRPVGRTTSCRRRPGTRPFRRFGTWVQDVSGVAITSVCSWIFVAQNR